MPPSRRYRVSRSYLHLNRGLTSPLATAMNFIPISYFSGSHCGARAHRLSHAFPPFLSLTAYLYLYLSLSLYLSFYYQSSPLPLLATSGLYSELFRHPACSATEKRTTTRATSLRNDTTSERPSVSASSSSLANFSPFFPAPSRRAVLSLANTNSANAPRGREIREGCMPV